MTESDSGSASVGLSQTIYSGGRIGHGIGAAEANVLAGRENLRSVEQQVLASVIQAYVDVQRDMEILTIRQDNLTVLRRQLDESNARFEVGEITRTDVAQSESRLAQSQADLANAQAQLSVSRAAYAAVIGQAPTNLETPPMLPGVPTDFDIALDEILDTWRVLPVLLGPQRVAPRHRYRDAIPSPAPAPPPSTIPASAPASPSAAIRHGGNPA